MLLSVPGQTIGVSVFTDFLIEALGLSRDQLSLAYMIGTLASASVLSFGGLLLDRWGSRKFGIYVSLCFGIVLVGLSFIQDAVGFLSQNLHAVPIALWAMILMSLGFFLIRFLGQGSMTLVSRNLPMQWFTRKRGLVSAIVGTVVSFGFNAAPALYDQLIAANGWQGAWRLSGFTVFFIGSLLFAFIVRDTPESVGLNQDGDSIVPNTEDGNDHAAKFVADTSSANDKELSHALGTFSFWVFALSLGLFSLYVTGFTFHVVSIFSEAGIDRSIAVSIFIPISIFSVLINALVSTMSDHIRLKWILVVMISGLIISMVSVAFLTPGIAFTALIIAGNALAGGTFNALSTLVWPRLYGTRHLGSISGFAMGIIVAGSALGPIMLSSSLSLFGSYASVALALAGLAALLLISGICTREPVPPGKRLGPN